MFIYIDVGLSFCILSVYLQSVYLFTCMSRFEYLNYLYLVWFFLYVSAFIIQEFYQTTTNGSYVASLGCDGVMDTFSLTDDTVDQSWSITLKNTIRIIWIYVSLGTGGEWYVIITLIWFDIPFLIVSNTEI